MRFDIITIFPDIFSSYFKESIIKRAEEEKLIDIKVHNLRDYTEDKHKTVDDTPYGGGAGMVLKIEPIYNCVNAIKSQILNPKSQTNSKSKIQNYKTRTILFSAKGKKYSQSDAERLSKYNNLILICGRYEGVDERVAEHIADEEISIGDYVLTGGEIPAMVLVDSITRLLPGVLGNAESLKEESFAGIQNSRLPKPGTGGQAKFKIQNFVLEYPQFTKPEDFQGWEVPKVLLSGNHKEIKEWRKGNAKSKM
ncbi:tRNA (guanine-N(1)-)-methyltransferase [bacterium BMS3Abin15]|nr:tRNA (guanine-N(1)-)-methyltransferase [bacterium BMS3Abin15]HDZ85770.1 tRNA (guanosine(37)-N1)-methyltransferase TrmD [Candidatus Moranbacteria bacterium]